MRTFIFTFLFMLTSGMNSSSLYAFYKCIDNKGRIAFRDTPCPSNQKIIEAQKHIKKNNDELPPFDPASVRWVPSFGLSSFYPGMKGDDIRELQMFLKRDPEVYPEGDITGYVDPPTEAAILRFKEKHNVKTSDRIPLDIRAEIYRQTKDRTRDVWKRLIGPYATLTRTSREYNNDRSPPYNIFRIAKRVHELINEMRVFGGQYHTEWDVSVAKAAQAHSDYQAKENKDFVAEDAVCNYPFILHQNFEIGFAPRHRLDYFDINYSSVGENIGSVYSTRNKVRLLKKGRKTIKCGGRNIFYQTTNREDEISAKRDYDRAKEAKKRLFSKKPRVEWENREWLSEEEIARKVVAGWMDSTPHRRNLLNGKWTDTGVGVAFVGDLFIITQKFIAR